MNRSELQDVAVSQLHRNPGRCKYALARTIAEVTGMDNLTVEKALDHPRFAEMTERQGIMLYPKSH